MRQIHSLIMITYKRNEKEISVHRVMIIDPVHRTIRTDTETIEPEIHRITQIDISIIRTGTHRIHIGVIIEVIAIIGHHI